MKSPNCKEVDLEIDAVKDETELLELDVHHHRPLARAHLEHNKHHATSATQKL